MNDQNICIIYKYEFKLGQSTVKLVESIHTFSTLCKYVYVNIGIIQRRFMKFKVGDFSLGKQPSCILCVKMATQFRRSKHRNLY